MRWSRLQGFRSTPDASVTFPAPMSVTTGTRLRHYEIRSLLGKGGMGEVYLALDTQLGRPVALKLLPAEVVSDEGRLRRFKQEARATSALNHPNIITIHEIGSDGGRHFIATEFVDGVSLRQRMKSAPLKTHEALDIATQVAGALGAAHEAGVVHRDIKPENVMVRKDGYVKVLDFGLAKLARPETLAADSQAATLQDVATETGVVMGTVAYMSPEQARGQKVDARSDIFSFGVMLYEMLAGGRPFEGETNSDVLAALLKEEPAPLAARAPGVPAELERIVGKCLEKDPARRYGSAREVSDELKGVAHLSEEKTEVLHASTGKVSRASTGEAAASRTRGDARRVSRRMLLAGVVALAVAIAGSYLFLRYRNLSWARDSVAQVEKLAHAEQYFAAYDLAVKIEEYLPGDETIKRLLPEISDTLSVAVEPAGARVFLKPFTSDGGGNPPRRRLVGTTPFKDLRVARGDYILSVEKEGYAPLERTVSSALGRNAGDEPDYAVRVEGRLVEAAKVPDRMVFVPGGKYRLVGWGRSGNAEVQLDDFFVDRYEVSNRDYKEFVSAGGYMKQQFWQHPFMKEGKEVGREEAVREFKDRTGLPGPRNWSNGTYPEGKENHPVTNISWHEAAAYAAFRGKRLPTLFQWEKAARDGMTSRIFGMVMPWGWIGATDYVNDRGNFKSSGTVPVDSFEFGMSPHGVYNMAGNVAEWCLNEQSGGFTTAGGSWESPHYMFAFYGGLPGFYNSDQLGFRSVLNSSEARGDQGATPINTDDEVPVYKPSSDADLRAMVSHYRYDKTPLDPQVVETIETDDWRREKVTFAGADGERAIAYLYLPKNFPRPLQVVHFVPADSVWSGYPLPQTVEDNFTPAIRSGRAVLAVALKGYGERKFPPDYVRPKASTVRFRDLAVNWITDLRRGLDYLETRDDIDTRKLAFFGASGGVSFGLILTAIEPRYRAVIFQSGGLRKSVSAAIAETNEANFAPHIGAPKLMLNGRYDENLNFRSEIEPLFKLLREPKRQLLYDSGHVPPREAKAQAINAWLDETLGPVGR